MSRIFLALTAAVALTACGQGGFKVDNVGKSAGQNLSFKLGCGVEGKFETMAELCRALETEKNPACDEAERAQIFAERCPGDFKPGGKKLDLGKLGIGNGMDKLPETDATPKPAEPGKPSPVPAPAPTQPAPAPTQPTPPVKPVTPPVPDIGTPKPPVPAPTPSPVPVAPAPKPVTPPVREPDFSKVITSFEVNEGEAIRLSILRKDQEPTVYEIGCTKSLTASLDRVESLLMISGSQIFASRKPTDPKTALGKVATCKGAITAGASDTPQSNQRIDRVEMDHGALATVRTMENLKAEIRCVKNKATALVDVKTGIALLPGAVLMVKTGDGEAVPMRIYHCKQL